MQIIYIYIYVYGHKQCIYIYIHTHILFSSSSSARQKSAAACRPPTPADIVNIIIIIIIIVINHIYAFICVLLVVLFIVCLFPPTPANRVGCERAKALTCFAPALAETAVQLGCISSAGPAACTYGQFSHFQLANFQIEGLKSHIQIHRLVCLTIVSPAFPSVQKYICTYIYIYIYI